MNKAATNFKKTNNAGNADTRSGEEWFRLAMDWYKMYLDNGKAVKDTMDRLKNLDPFPEASEMYYVRDRIDPVSKLNADSARLRRLGKALLKGCEKYFRKAFGMFEWKYRVEVGKSNSDECGKILGAWGDAVYALAIIKVNRAFYKDADKYFKEAIRLYEKLKDVVEPEPDVGILRRLGKAHYEVAAINMRRSLFDEAKESFGKTVTYYDLVLKKSTKLGPQDQRVLGDTYFELGRVAWERYLFWITCMDGSFVEALENEACDELKECGGRLELDERGYQSFRDAEEIERPAGELLSGSVEKLRNYRKDGTDCFKKAKECYLNLLYEGNRRDLRNLGEIYSIEGRVNRYMYLLYRHWQKTGRSLQTVEGENIVDCDKVISDNVENAIKNFENAAKYLADSQEKYHGEDNEKMDAVWNILGAAYFRLYLTYRFGNRSGEEEKKENALKSARKFFGNSKCGVLRILVSLSTDVGYPLVNSGEIFSVLEAGGDVNRDAVFFNSVVLGGKSENELKTGTTGYSERRKDVAGDGVKESVKLKFRRKVEEVVGYRNEFEGKEALRRYMEIYVRSMYVISRLEVNCEFVKKIAHYKKREFARAMLFDGDHLRLYSENSFNDPKEGRVLVDNCLLGDTMRNISDEEMLEEEKNSGFLNFAGCFSFNYDCLNQFRLYGTEDDVEGTGLSLVFNRSFFKEELRQSFVANFSDLATVLCENRGNKEESRIWLEDLQSLCDKGRPRRPWSPLFRCAYLDPETELVDTVGQKERYLFFREGTVKDYWVYKRYVNQIVRDVNVELMKMRVLAVGLDRKILERLLVQLRYLVKHVAFKVEQECRIVRNRNLDMDAEEIKNDQGNRFNLFIEYEPHVAQHIEEVYFGPTAKGIDVFVDNLKLHDLRDVKCLKSKNPLAEDMNPKGRGCPLR